MKLVNLLFLLALLIPNHGAVFAAYAVWLVILLLRAHRAKDRVARGVYCGSAGFAVAMLLLNLYAMLKNT